MKLGKKTWITSVLLTICMSFSFLGTSCALTEVQRGKRYEFVESKVTVAATATLEDLSNYIPKTGWGIDEKT